MHRFKIQTRDNSHFEIAGEELHHLVHVMRLTIDSNVVGFDNSGGQWLGIIETLTKEAASCRIIEEEFPVVEAKTRVYLVMGLAKGEKMEWVIQKGTELGMAGFVPLRTKRSVVQLEGGKAKDRVVRWQKIAAEAVKQSRRVIEPEVAAITNWNDLGKVLPPDTQWIIPYEDEKTRSLHSCLGQLNPRFPVAILIGAEGGFSPEEVTWAQQELQAISVSLGNRILRTETAALAALTMVLAHYGDLG
ncbi:16S rRNA (uracil(1498)-N(3))-methyltransferase [Dehalobacter sp. DCM]|uniref:RsmE family RNA methyltransferase n=1 Tax=Dehalobacter sp. DCM TaxID=2907827 RepID=UPI003081F9AC|nr:16S rRNA (uracil(1498)-N(3))-methyltransferase [Dehalobacter sp. DCM]